MKYLYITFQRKMSLSWWSFLGLSLWTATMGWAKPVVPTDSPKADASFGTFAPREATLLSAPLQAFMPSPGPLVVRGADGQVTVTVPVAKRLQVRRAVLHLVAKNSVSLLAGRSQLQVRLNGRVVAQIPLDPRLPQLDAQIALPLRDVGPGYYALTFAAAQHYAMECEDPSAPELWTEIDTERSWIRLEGGLRQWEASVSDWDGVFDPRLWGVQTLLVAAPGATDQQRLRWGGLAAQAAALRLNYVPLRVRSVPVRSVANGASGATTPLRIDDTEWPDADAVLVGTAASLQPVLDAAWQARIRGPFLALWPLPQRPARFALVVSGTTEQEVDHALHALALMRAPLPRASAAVVSVPQRPSLPDLPGADRIRPEQTVTFAQLGVRTVQWQGRYGEVRVPLVVPADLYAPHEASVRLRLRFAYGAGLREDSVINVSVNGQFQAAVALRQPDGHQARQHELAIPMSSFRAGRNELTVAASMVPSHSGRCEWVQTDNLRLTLFDDSSLEWPAAARLARLPDLELWQRAAFPHASAAWGAGTAVAVADPQPQSMAAAWTLAAKLAQVQGSPWLEAHWQVGLDGRWNHEHVLLVGSLPSLPADWRPMALGRADRGDGVDAASLLPSAWGVAVKAPAVREVLAGGVLGEGALLMQTALPGRSAGTLTLLTADEPLRLQAQTDMLVEPALWGQLRGHVAWWHDRDDVHVQSWFDQYAVGQASWWLKLSFTLSSRPWLGVGILGVFFFVLAWVTWNLLRRWRGAASLADDVRLPGGGG
jgi:hypothetical protein